MMMQTSNGGRNDTSLSNDRYTMWSAGSALFVRELKTGQLVAFSSMRADFEQSAAEFRFDYFEEE